MSMINDQQLLDAFVRERSAEAFGELVARHVDLVHSAARRQAQDEHEAQDITQAVFLVLARKSASIRNARHLPAWLLKTTHFAALDARKAAIRRRKHEQEVSSMNAEAVLPPDPEWDRLSPHVDGALAKLSETDRAAVVGHCIQQLQMTEIAAMLGVTEMAARKRVQRAMERLRKHLKGTQVSCAALAVLLAAHAVRAAPAGMGKIVAVTALNAGTAGTAKIAMSLAKGVMKMAFWKTAKMTAVAALLPLVGACVAVLWEESRRESPAPQPAATVASTQVAQPADPVLSGVILSEIHLFDQTQPAPQGEIYLSGDVPRPGVYSLNRQISIKMALAAAGADLDKPTSMTLIRRRGNTEEKHDYDLGSIMSGKQEDVYLEANDMVQVTKK